LFLQEANVLPDKLFLWPYGGASLEQAIADLTPVLAKSCIGKQFGAPGPYGSMVEFIALTCRNHNINPWWLMVSAEREQSSLSAKEMDQKALVAWLGVVGQDVGRTSMPGYYGLYTQVVRFCEVSSWLLGVESALGWPEYYRTTKEAPRYQLGKPVNVGTEGCKKSDGTPYAPGVRLDWVPASRGEYLQLMFTPHLKVLAVNEIIAKTWVPPKFLL
jgi:hypothetical protein